MPTTPEQTPPEPTPHVQTPAGKPRARALKIPFGGRPGPWNAITDVPGVEVGYVTLIEGSGPMRVGAGPGQPGRRGLMGAHAAIVGT